MGAYLATTHPTMQFNVISFGAPAVGNQAFKNWSENTLSNLSVWRFVNLSDFAPRFFPYWTGYHHAGHLFQVRRRSSEAYYRQVGGGNYEGVYPAWDTSKYFMIACIFFSSTCSQYAFHFV